MFSFITGYVKYRVKTNSANTLINRLRYEIPIYGIKLNSPDCVAFTTGYRYKVNAELVIKALNCEIISLSSCGLLALAYRYKKRIGIWLGAVLSVILIAVFSNVIWEVRVCGKNGVSYTSLTNSLAEFGISEGRFIDKSNLEKVYNNILINEHLISWLSVNFDGTIAKVSVKEINKIPERVDRNKPVNVVAKCDGVIKRIDVFDGTKEIENGSAVTKGQLLISSLTETIASGTFMKTARGNVWAVTVHNYDIHIPKSSNTIEKCSNIKKYGIMVLGKKIPFYIDNTIRSKLCDFKYEYKRADILDYIKLPFYITCEHIENYKMSICNNDEISAKKKADTELEKRIVNELKDAEIISRTEVSVENETEYIFRYELTCIENIAVNMAFQSESM